MCPKHGSRAKYYPPKRELQETAHVQEQEQWFHVNGWLFTISLQLHKHGACWPEVHFQWIDWAWNQTGITLLFHSGFTQFTYNSLLIVLDHQLILCSQENAAVALVPSLCLLQIPTAIQWKKSVSQLCGEIPSLRAHAHICQLLAAGLNASKINKWNKTVTALNMRWN